MSSPDATSAAGELGAQEKTLGLGPVGRGFRIPITNLRGSCLFREVGVACPFFF